MASAPALHATEGSDRLFERAELWPVRLRLRSASGLTLWGSARSDDERDRVLTSARRLVLLASEQELWRCVHSPAPNELRVLKGWRILQEGLQDAPISWLAPVFTCDYPAISGALLTRETWCHARSEELLNALNLLTDIARTLQLAELAEAMRTPDVTAILDRLTFLDDDEPPLDAGTLHASVLRRVVQLGMDQLDGRITGSRGPVPAPPG